MTLRRSLTLLVVLAALLLGTTSPLVEDAAEWIGQRIHQPAPAHQYIDDCGGH